MHRYDRKWNLVLHYWVWGWSRKGLRFLHWKGHNFPSHLSLESCMPLASEYRTAQIRMWTMKSLAKDPKDFTYPQSCGESWGELLGCVTILRRYLFPWLLLCCFALRHLLLLWSCTLYSGSCCSSWAQVGPITPAILLLLCLSTGKWRISWKNAFKF